MIFFLLNPPDVGHSNRTELSNSFFSSFREDLIYGRKFLFFVEFWIALKSFIIKNFMKKIFGNFKKFKIFKSLKI